MKLTKQFLIIALIVIISFMVKLDAKASTFTYWDGASWAKVYNYFDNTIDISYDVTYDYEEAYKMLEYVNEIRREAGVQELIMKDDLMDVAMQRAAETVICWEHKRPNGCSDLQTLSMYIFGENIYNGDNDAKIATNKLKNSKGHYDTMVDPQYKYVGFGDVDGNWVQIFCVEDVYYENGFDLQHPENNKPVQWDKMTCGNRKNYSEKFTAKINPEMYSIDFYMNEIVSGKLVKDTVYVGDNQKLSVILSCENGRGVNHCGVDASEYNVTFGKQLAKVNNDISCVDAGETTVTVSLKDYPQMKASQKIKAKVKKGSVVTRKGQQYKVTSNTKEKKSCTFLKAAGSKDKIDVPDTIKIGNNTYKVTSIAEKAFYQNTAVEEVNIGKNVTKIGKSAFNGCKNLKKITIKSANLAKVEKNALKGISKDAVVKIPNNVYSKYKDLLPSSVQVQDNVVRKGYTYTINGCKYKVTDSKKKKVTFLKADKSQISATVPDKIKIKNKEYKVTSIAGKAFYQNTAVEEVNIGNNVTKIGKSAFNGCKNLKKITIKSSNLAKVEKNALKGIHQDAVIKVPKSKVQAYKQLLKNKGQKSSVQVKKK